MAYQALKQRFTKVVEIINLPNNTLVGEKLGISRQDVENYLNVKDPKRKLPSYPKLVSILEKMPEISPEWFVLGVGNMLRENSGNFVEESKSEYQKMDIYMMQKMWEEDRKELSRLRELNIELTQNLISVSECGNKSKTAG